jgi:ubiquinone/menaquinone biosynthesis C-methylase UbiE
MCICGEEHTLESLPSPARSSGRRACSLASQCKYASGALTLEVCAAVGILAMHCAFMRGAERVIIIDRAQYRLERAKEVRAAL